MKKTYTTPIVIIDEAEVDGHLMVTSIQLSSETGSEEYVKEQNADEGDWDISW